MSCKRLRKKPKADASLLFFFLILLGEMLILVQKGSWKRQPFFDNARGVFFFTGEGPENPACGRRNALFLQ